MVFCLLLSSRGWWRLVSRSLRPRALRLGQKAPIRPVPGLRSEFAALRQHHLRLRLDDFQPWATSRGRPPQFPRCALSSSQHRLLSASEDVVTSHFRRVASTPVLVMVFGDFIDITSGVERLPAP